MIIQQAKADVYEINPCNMEDGCYYLAIDDDGDYHIVTKEDNEIVVIGDGFGLVYSPEGLSELGIKLINEIQITKIEYKVKA